MNCILNLICSLKLVTTSASSSTFMTYDYDIFIRSQAEIEASPRRICFNRIMMPFLNSWMCYWAMMDHFKFEQDFFSSPRISFYSLSISRLWLWPLPLPPDHHNLLPITTTIMELFNWIQDKFNGGQGHNNSNATFADAGNELFFWVTTTIIMLVTRKIPSEPTLLT